MRAPEIAPAAKAETRVEFDFTDFCDDSGSQVHTVVPSSDPDDPLLDALLKLASGPMYVPVGEAL